MWGAQTGILRPTLLVAAWASAASLVVMEVVLIPARGPYGLGLDSLAYWLAPREQLYDHPPHLLTGRYLYSPAFAEALRPLTLLPWHAFAVLWTLPLVGVYLWLLAPMRWRWRAPLLVLLGLDDVLLGNVHGLLAATLVLSARYPALWAVALLTKPPVAVGLVYEIVRREWRCVLLATAATAAAVAVSLPLGFALWAAWARTLTEGDVAPALGFPIYLARLAVAVGLSIAAARTGRRWLLAVAALLALPMLDPASLGILAAVPRLTRGLGPGTARSPAAFG